MRAWLTVLTLFLAGVCVLQVILLSTITDDINSIYEIAKTNKQTIQNMNERINVLSKEKEKTETKEHRPVSKYATQ